MHIFFGNLGFQACKLSMRRVTSVEFTLAPPHCVNTGRLAHAAAHCLSAARVSPLSKQIAQRHETMVFLDLTHPSCSPNMCFHFPHWARLRPSHQRGLHFWSDSTGTPGGLNLWARFSQMRMSAPTILWLSRCVLV